MQTCLARQRAANSCRPASRPAFANSVTGRRRCSQIARVGSADTATFEAEVLKADKPVLVDFWSSWCGPCKLVAPLMDFVEKEYGGALKVVKVEHDANPKLIAEYKVYGLPTLLLFKNGAPVEGSKREGAVSKPALLKYLEAQGFQPSPKA